MHAIVGVWCLHLAYVDSFVNRIREVELISTYRIPHEYAKYYFLLKNNMHTPSTVLIIMAYVKLNTFLLRLRQVGNQKIGSVVNLKIESIEFPHKRS